MQLLYVHNGPVSRVSPRTMLPILRLASNSATVQYLDGSNWSVHFRPTTKPKAL